MSNNEWAAQRRGGISESRGNNVIYIGRASFRMEPAPAVAEDFDHDLDDQIDDERVANGGRPDSGGQDIEPPYLKLRAFSDDRIPTRRAARRPPRST